MSKEAAASKADAGRIVVRKPPRRFIRPVERQRMRPWLIEHLDKNDVVGLCWQNKRDKIFRISWKHAANQCFNMAKDTSLFEKWAIHTGRHYDSDHKRWKANFRCALNSLPDVVELKEQGVKKGNNAFKVYRFLDEKESKFGKDAKAFVKERKQKKEVLDSKDTGDASNTGSDAEKTSEEEEDYVDEGAQNAASSQIATKTNLGGDHNDHSYAENTANGNQGSSVRSQKEPHKLPDLLPRLEELKTIYSSHYTVINTLQQGGGTVFTNAEGKKMPIPTGEESLSQPCQTDVLRKILGHKSPVATSVEDGVKTEMQVEESASNGSLSSSSSTDLNQLAQLGIQLELRKREPNQPADSTSTAYVYLCQWCEKCFPTKLELFQHFLLLHQDMLVLTQASAHVQASVSQAATEGDDSKSMLQREIEVLEEQVLGISRGNIQSPAVVEETVIEDGQVLDLTNDGDPSPAVYVEHYVLDLSMKNEKDGSDVNDIQEYALDLSMNRSNTPSHQNSPAHTPSLTPQASQYHSGGEENSVVFEVSNIVSDGKSHLRQHSVEDLLHAEILMSLKTGVTAGKIELSSLKMEQSLSELPSPQSLKRKYEDLKSDHPVSLTDSIKSLNNKQKTEKEGTAVNEDSSNFVVDVHKGKSLALRKAVKGLITDLKEMITASMVTYPYCCVVCGRTYTRDIYLSAHIRSHSGLIPYKCGICGKKFADNGTLRRHVKSHKTPFLYECDICDKGFQHSFALKLHMKMHKTEDASTARYSNAGRGTLVSDSSAEKSIYECEVCGKRLRRGDELKVHLQSHQSRTCKICLKEFSNLSYHMRQHSEDKPYSCNICDKSFGFSGALTSHVKSHLRDKIRGIKSKTKKETDRHAKKDHSRSPQDKSSSSKKFTKTAKTKVGDRNSIFKNGSLIAGKMEATTLCDEVVIKSDQDSVRSVSSEKLQQPSPKGRTSPRSIVRGMRVLFGKGRLSPSHLMSKKKSNSPEEPKKIVERPNESSYSCGLQGLDTERCTNLDSTTPAKRGPLILGKDIHRTYNCFGRLKCLSCPKSFPSHHQLQIHAASHSEPRFKCFICDRAFCHRYQLQVHQISHTGLPKYRCQKCNLSFLCFFSLSMHMKLHNSDRKTVQTVLASDSGAVSLQQKTRTHSRSCKSRRGVSCSICGEKFMNRYRLRKHRAQAHIHCIIAPVPSQSPCFLCQSCGKQFLSEESYFSHACSVETVPRNEPALSLGTDPTHIACDSVQPGVGSHDKHSIVSKEYSCYKCNKCFHVMPDLRRHLVECHSNLSYKCEACDELFSTEEELHNHIQSHVQDIKEEPQEDHLYIRPEEQLPSQLHLMSETGTYSHQDIDQNKLYIHLIEKGDKKYCDFDKLNQTSEIQGTESTGVDDYKYILKENAAHSPPSKESFSKV
ncbi:hypothetical protein CHS0354_036608 [Potamilus streckersoni]|uniref:Uncharacterized protein n=1 Tax=Potamilus streckersoni TaxID=2493646 RepID=A0AAE0TFH5_9BIVA|nr:hypothetical protein CHS0354_036608 [Potamilus streckersoni]